MAPAAGFSRKPLGAAPENRPRTLLNPGGGWRQPVFEALDLQAPRDQAPRPARTPDCRCRTHDEFLRLDGSSVCDTMKWPSLRARRPSVREMPGRCGLCLAAEPHRPIYSL